MFSDEVQSILNEALFILSDIDSELSNLILDFSGLIKNENCCCQVLISALEIRTQLLEHRLYHHREFTDILEKHIVATTFCPDCGEKKDTIQLTINTSLIKHLLDDCHKAYCKHLHQYYPNEKHVFYAFSYVDELENPVEVDDLLWNEAGCNKQFVENHFKQ